jgi:cell wall-associated NlpC family hydrolase
VSRAAVTEWLGFTEPVESPFLLHYAGPNAAEPVARAKELGKRSVSGDIVGSGRDVNTRLAGSVSRFRRGIAIAAGLVSLSGLAVFATGAGAAPQPSVSQVQAKINQLTTQFDKVSEQLDQASQQLSAAQAKLGQVQVRLKNANTQFQTAQANMAATAAAAFEDTGATSVAGVLTSGDPAVLLQQGSLLMELSGNRSAQTKQLLTDASQLAGVEQEMSRTETGIAGLKRQLSDHKSSLGKLIGTQRATLASLTVPQQQTVQTNSIGGGGTGTTSATYSGTTSTQGGKAVAFAYAQLGKPYQWGATGPGSYDCSGLAQAAWAAAGVSIPRTTYAQWAALPHISTSALEPGDLLYFDGIGHVAIYVGGGDIIDAPQTGQDVQKIPLAGWYQSTLVGAARP